MKNRKRKEKIIRRFFSNLYTREEAEQFFRDVKDRDNDPLIENMIWELMEESELQKNPGSVLYEQYRQEARQLLAKIAKKRKMHIRRMTLYVASIASLLFLVVFTLYQISTREPSSLTYAEAATSYGERKQLELTDSTKVLLNSRTHLVYPHTFGKKERRIRLSGEAFFDVSKDKTPFIVETSRFDIQVLGTAFNVKAYEDDERVSVAVDRGHVRISMREASFVLNRNEKVTINVRTGEIAKEANLNRSPFAWMKGGLYFDRTPIRDVASELERIYGCRIVFNENETFHNLISGEHDNQSLDAVLQSIEQTSGIKHTKKADTIILYKHDF